MCGGVGLKLMEPSIRTGLARDSTSDKKRQQIKPEFCLSGFFARETGIKGRPAYPNFAPSNI
jgi:hypothetical protein